MREYKFRGKCVERDKWVYGYYVKGIPAEGGKRMRLSDENTREGRHLTPEERIALQAEEIKQLWQENEQLRAQLDEWKYEVKCHMDEVIAREKQIEQLQAQVAQYREALIIANHRMPDVGQFCACGKCKTCGADINYVGYEHLYKKNKE